MLYQKIRPARVLMSFLLVLCLLTALFPASAGAVSPEELRSGGLMTEEAVREILTEEGERNWNAWAEFILTEDYIRDQIAKAQERLDDAYVERVAEWNGIAGQDGFYRQAVAKAYGEAGTALYDLLADICYLFLLDSEAANYSVFETYVKGRAEKEGDENLILSVPPTESSNPYFSEDSCRLMPVPVGSLDHEAVETVYQAFFSDNPQYYFVGTRGSLINADGVEYGIDLFVYRIFRDGARFEEVFDAVQRASSEYRDSLWEEKDDFRKLRAIYDWVADRADYDYFAAGMVSDEALEAGYPDSFRKYLTEEQREKGHGEDEMYSGNPDETLSQTLWSVFVREVQDDYPVFCSDASTPLPASMRPTRYYTVCAGYSQAVSLLCRMENLSAIQVSGNGHAWNRAEAQGAWVNLDVTWDDPGFGPEGPGPAMRYDYFARSDAVFRESRDHEQNPVMKAIQEMFPCNRDYVPYSHTYARMDGKWVHGVYDAQGLIYLEENEMPVVDEKGQFVTVDVADGMTELVDIPYIPGYEEHDDSVYPLSLLPAA